MKTALVHDWLITNAGAELTLNYLYRIFPAPIYTLFWDPKIQRDNFLPDAEIHTTSLQKIPGITKIYRKLLALYPEAIEEFNLNGYDLIISSSHCVAKGVLTTAKQMHVSYVHSPMRYAWDMHFPYFELSNIRGWKKHYARKVLHRIRTWDVISSNRVDHFTCNSHYIAKRIKRAYNREATVIYPPVNIDEFSSTSEKDDYFVAVSRFVQYKRMDIIVDAFTRMRDKKLVVIGGGPDEKKLKKIAAGSKNITILDYIPFGDLKNYIEKARAFIFASEEDFGSLPVQAQASGTPVLAYGVGGAKETVVHGKTGLHFHEQTPEAVMDIIKEFEKKEDLFAVADIRKNAERFSFGNFKQNFEEFIKNKAEIFF